MDLWGLQGPHISFSMEKDAVVTAFSALAHDVRLDMLGMLHQAGEAGLSLEELSARLGMSGAVLAFHIDQLRAARLIHVLPGAGAHYGADPHAIDHVVGYLRNLGSHDIAAEPAPAPERRFNVLFLCKGNSARSIMAEAILRKHGAAHFCAFSAGYEPAGSVNPLTLKIFAGFDYPVEGLRSKSWHEFTGPGAPMMDFVFTVCDETAGQACPVWPGKPVTAHWAIDDPVLAEGSDLQKERAFVQAFKYLRTRITIFLSLPLSRIDELALSARLAEIGHGEGETAQNASLA